MHRMSVLDPELYAGLGTLGNLGGFAVAPEVAGYLRRLPPSVPGCQCPRMPGR